MLTFILAASAKSAQIGLHTWLAAAMAGPTPVSSLLHSSTMVTAGIYLLMRLSPILELSSLSLIIIIWLGSLTALLGASCGLVENDIKKIIAYSTSSQLGYMMVAIGVSQTSLALFHLINHAFFKSLLFLSAGAFIHAVLDQQDIRKMGSLVLLTPITYCVFVLGSLSLMAFPFMTGFYSKDLLLEILIIPLNLTHSFAYIFTFLAALLTSIYSLRLLILAMLTRPQFPLSILHFVHDSPSPMTFPMLFLSFFALTLGYLTQDLFLQYGTPFIGLFTHPNHIRLLDPSFIPSSSLFAFLPLALLIILFFLALPFTSPTSSRQVSHIIYPSSPSSSSSSTYTSSPLTSWRYSSIFDPSFMTYFNIFNHHIMLSSLRLSVYIYRYFDKGLCEIFGPIGFIRILHFLGYQFELLITGFLPHSTIMFLCLLFFLSFLSLPTPLLLSFLFIFF